MTQSQIATLGAGCFWCTESIFQRLSGVENVISGYSGGSTMNPTYEDICTGTTGHAEAIQLSYQPGIIPFRTLLEVFFATHDATTLNRQGADVGTQYRSVIFYHTEEQKTETLEVISSLSNASKVVTQVVPRTTFNPAEEYHQNFYNNNPSHGYCSMIIRKKIKLLESTFGHLLR